MLEWFDSLLVFPSDLAFLKYITICTILVISVSLAYGLIVSLISAVFNRH